MNIVSIAIERGFISGLPYINTSNIRPNENWMGLSLYHPDLKLIKDDKLIKISLNGIMVRIPENPSEEWYKLNDSGSIKYVAFYIGEEIKYETYSGVIPSEKFINSFFNE